MGVTAEDLERAMDLMVATLTGALDVDWQVNAGSLEWTCWETVEHTADDMFAYAGQLAAPTQDRYVPFLAEERRPGGPANSVFADPDDGAAGLVEVLKASGALLVAMVRTASPDVRSYHPSGVSDPEGFAAMGIVEALVHLHDIAEALAISWEPPPADICARVLERLFPDAPTDTDRWAALLWATGRGDLPGHERLVKWRWHSAPLG